MTVELRVTKRGHVYKEGVQTIRRFNVQVRDQAKPGGAPTGAHTPSEWLGWLLETLGGGVAPDMEPHIPLPSPPAVDDLLHEPGRPEQIGLSTEQPGQDVHTPQHPGQGADSPGHDPHNPAGPDIHPDSPHHDPHQAEPQGPGLDDPIHDLHPLPLPAPPSWMPPAYEPVPVPVWEPPKAPPPPANLESEMRRALRRRARALRCGRRAGDLPAVRL